MKTPRFSISISADDWLGLQRGLLTSDGYENAAGISCGIATFERSATLLARTVRLAKPEEYIERLPYHLEVAPSFYNSLINDCMPRQLTPTIAHSHPFSGEARYSPSDDLGERRLLPVLSSLSPSRHAYSMLLTQTSASARVLKDARFFQSQEIVALGLTSKTIQQLNANQPTDETHDRQVRAFGEEGQQTLQSLRVGIVGLGGTGSSVADQIARIGIRNLILVDPDQIEPSNVSRIVAATRSDIGKGKAQVAARHVKELGADQVQALPESVVRQGTLMKLRDRHLIFSCVDSDLARSALNRFAYQYLVPVVDMGVRLDGRAGKISAAAARVSVVTPGGTCLRCSHHLDSERIRAESLPIEERKKLAQEGYIIGIDEPVPAVTSINTAVAGLAVTSGLNLWVGLTGAAQPPDQLWDITGGSIFTAMPIHDEACDVCNPETGVKALGDLQRVSAYD